MLHFHSYVHVQTSLSQYIHSFGGAFTFFHPWISILGEIVRQIAVFGCFVSLPLAKHTIPIFHPLWPTTVSPSTAVYVSVCVYAGAGALSHFAPRICLPCSRVCVIFNNIFVWTFNAPTRQLVMCILYIIYNAKYIYIPVCVKCIQYDASSVCSMLELDSVQSIYYYTPQTKSIHFFCQLLSTLSLTISNQKYQYQFCFSFL